METRRLIPMRCVRHVVLACIGLATLSAAPARADQWSLLLNGKAVHLEHPNGQKYNESNWGAGFQYEFTQTESKWIPFVTASGFKDSYNHPSYYAGGGALRRFAFSANPDALHVDAGVVAFLMVRRGYMHGDPFLGALPVLSVGTNRIAVNITYIPKVEPKMVALYFFQLKVGIF